MYSLLVCLYVAPPRQFRHALLAEALQNMLDSSIGRKIASLTQQQLFTELINDAYKPKMHKIYSLFLRGVKVDFALNVRKSPFALKRIEQEVCFCLSFQPLHMTSGLHARLLSVFSGDASNAHCRHHHCQHWQH